MRRTLICMLLGAVLIWGLAVTSLSAPHASAAPHIPVPVPGCANTDYSCGFLHGFQAGRQAKELGLCAQRRAYRSAQTASERGYRDAFTYYCPA